MSNDKRMFLIRNIEDLENEKVETLEYEAITDSEIVGEFEYKLYKFMIWDYSKKKQGEDRKLCLRIKQKSISDKDELWKNARPNGFYHGGGIPEELITLSSLFLRRRLKLGPMVRKNDKPYIYSTRDKIWIDKPLIEGKRNLCKIVEWFKILENLDIKYHQKFILAVRMYHRAVLMIEEDPDLAYLNLVSAIEVLCQETEIGKVPLSEIKPKLSKVLQKIDDEELCHEIEEATLSTERFISRKFVRFILNHTENSFWEEEDRPEHGKIEKNELEKSLKKIYNQRSRTLHKGEPFPPGAAEPSAMNAEINFSSATIKGDKKWLQSQYIPNISFFERLVNHVLKQFLIKNQIESNLSEE